MKERARRALGIRLDASEVAPPREDAAPRLLGRFDAAAVRHELATAGVLAALQARGYDDPAVTIERDEGEHRLLVAPRGGGETLLDLRMAEGALPVGEPLLRARGLDVLSVLSVHWLALQDPRAPFTPERPRLPGQGHPGLGLGRRLYTHVIDWARGWGKDALVSVPAYFHNAKFYSPPFTFLFAAEQGRFEALVRDLGQVPVAEASAAFEDGRVVERATSSAVEWRPGPMLVALSPALRAYVDSGGYRRARGEARDGNRFRLA